MLLPTHISGIQSIPRKSNNGRGADLEGEIICSYSEAKRAASIQTAAEITAARITAAAPERYDDYDYYAESKPSAHSAQPANKAQSGKNRKKKGKAGRSYS